MFAAPIIRPTDSKPTRRRGGRAERRPIIVRVLSLFALAVPLFIIGISQAAAATIPLDNLTSNPSVERDTAGWASWQGTLGRVPAPDAPDGAYVAQVSASGNSSYTIDSYGLRPPTPVAGMKYTGGAWVKATVATDGLPVRLTVREFGHSGEVGRASQRITLSSGAYAPISVTYTMQHTGDRLDMYLARSGPIVAGDSFYADDLSLTSQNCAASGTTPWSSPCWHPYSSTSPFNQPLPATPSIIPDSATVVRAMMAYGGANLFRTGANIATSDENQAVYYTDPSAPSYTVHCTEPWGTCDLEGVTLQIPASAQPEPGGPGGDHHMAVLDAQANMEYDFWGTGSLPAGGGTLNINWGGKTSLGGEGLNSNSNAANFGALAGTVRASELLAGHIDHALTLAVGCDSGTYVWPAVQSDVACPGGSGPAMGARLQLNMSPAEIDASAVPEWDKTIMRAFATYGAYVEDTGNHPWAIKAESSQSYTSLGQPDPWLTVATTNGWKLSNHVYYGDFSENIPWSSRLRVISPCVAQRTC